MSKNGKIDRRVVRTITSLQDALTQLMSEKSYAKIRVSEIVNLADVARPTFYMHFETKDALLFSLFDDVFSGFKQELTEKLSHGDLGDIEIGTDFFKYWVRHAEIFKILLDAEIDLIVIDQFRQCVAICTAKLRERTGMEPNQYTSYINDSIAGSLYMILKRWIEEGQQISAEEMGRCFSEMVSLSSFGIGSEAPQL